MNAEARVTELKLELPPAPKPVAVYKPLVIVGNLAYVSGHGPLKPDKSLMTGRVGADLDLEGGKAAARQVGLAILATLRNELGSLNRVKRLVKTLGMVNSTPDFLDHPKVINGFSELMADIFGQENGIGARSAVGMGSLPGNIAVEVEAIFEIGYAAKPVKTRLKSVLAVALVLVIGYLVWTGYRIWDLTKYKIRDAYAGWETGLLIIDHLKTHTNAWPKGWADLQAVAKSRKENGKPVYWPESDLANRVSVEWNTSPQQRLQAAKADGNPPVRWVTRRDGGLIKPVWGEHRDPNRMIIEYLRSIKTNASVL